MIVRTWSEVLAVALLFNLSPPTCAGPLLPIERFPIAQVAAAECGSLNLAHGLFWVRIESWGALRDVDRLDAIASEDGSQRSFLRTAGYCPIDRVYGLLRWSGQTGLVVKDLATNTNPSCDASDFIPERSGQIVCQQFNVLSTAVDQLRQTGVSLVSNTTALSDKNDALTRQVEDLSQRLGKLEKQSVSPAGNQGPPK